MSSVKTIRSFTNIAILLSALLIAPLFLAAQFFPLLQGFLNEVAEQYLPHHPTTSSTEKKKRVKAEKNSKDQKKSNKKLKTTNRMLEKDVEKLNKNNNILSTDNKELKSEYQKLHAKASKNSSIFNHMNKAKSADTIKIVNEISDRGSKIIRRGAMALGVGWIPYVGGAYDLYSLQEDFSDVCDLLSTIDTLSTLLYVDSFLYAQNHCDAPEFAIDALRRY